MSRRRSSSKQGTLGLVEQVLKVSQGFLVGGSNETSIQGVPSERIAFITSLPSTAVLVDGSTVSLPVPLDKLTERLTKLDPDWRKMAEYVLGNLRHLVRIQKGPGGAKALLTRNYADGVQERLGLPTLDHDITLSGDRRYLLEHDIHDYEKNILDMTDDELRQNFPRGDGIELTKLIANFIWQEAKLVRAGLIEPYGGNVRTVYYQIWPRLSRYGGFQKKHVYKEVSDQFSWLVLAKALSYHDLGLAEDPMYDFGGANPHVIALGEKDALELLLKALADVSWMACGGQSSTMTDEFFCEEFRKRVPGYYKHKRGIIVTLVDYDPAGYDICDTFARHLRIFGVKHPEFIRLVHPDNLTPEELERYKVDLRPDLPEEVWRPWLEETGGIGGEPYAVEVDAYVRSSARVKADFLRVAGPYLNPVTPAPPPRELEALKARFADAFVDALRPGVRPATARRRVLRAVEILVTEALAKLRPPKPAARQRLRRGQLGEDQSRA